VAAIAVREIQPSIPDGIRSRIEGRVAIPVDVRVDEHGRVVSARSAGAGGNGVQRYLAAQAEKAAREWRFNPAKSAGVPVAASKRIEFVFTR
jgi:TonB family protein